VAYLLFAVVVFWVALSWFMLSSNLFHFRQDTSNYRIFGLRKMWQNEQYFAFFKGISGITPTFLVEYA